MLPTRPRPVSSSTCSSCATPCCITATRVSCGVMLMRISSLTAGMRQQRSAPELAEQQIRFVQRQTHHARVAALDAADKRGPAPLDSISTGLVERFAARYILTDLLIVELAHMHLRSGQCHLDLIFELHRHCGMDLVRFS